MNAVAGRKLAIELMTEHGLIADGWEFAYDRAKNRFGACHHGLKRITLSFIRVEAHPEEDVKDTILHEIAHAIVGRAHGHNRNWARKAREIGCSGERTYQTEIEVRAKYTGTCPAGHRSQAHKRMKRQRSCGECDPTRFNLDHIITYKANW